MQWLICNPKQASVGCLRNRQTLNSKTPAIAAVKTACQRVMDTDLEGDKQGCACTVAVKAKNGMLSLACQGQRTAWSMTWRNIFPFSWPWSWPWLIQSISLLRWLVIAGGVSQETQMYA